MVNSIVGCRLAVEIFVVVHPAIVIVLDYSSWQLPFSFLFLVRRSISLTPADK